MAYKRNKARVKGEIPEGTSRTESGIEWCKAANGKINNKRAFFSTIVEAETIAMFYKMANSYKELYSLLPYGFTECNIIKYYEDAGVPYEDFNPLPLAEQPVRKMSFEEFAAREKKRAYYWINEKN